MASPNPPDAPADMTPDQIAAEIVRARFMAEIPNIPKLKPDAPDTGLTEALDVRWMDHQGTETEWYLVVMEPMSRGIMRRGYGCYIKKSIAFDQPSVKNAASRGEADYEAMAWAQNMAREMAIKSFAESDAKRIPPSDSGELERRLDALNPWLLHERRCGAEAGDESKCDCGINEAIRSVLDLFERLRKERDEAREALAYEREHWGGDS